MRDGQLAFRQAAVQALGDLADTALDLLEPGRAGRREGDLCPASRRRLPADQPLPGQLGAIPVEYGSGLMDRARAAAPDGVDAALDLAGTDEALDVSFVLVPDRTRIATIVSFDRGLKTGIRVLGGAPGADPGTEIRDAARLELARLAQDGKLTVYVSQSFPLAEVSQAHRSIMEGHTQGKIALIP